MSPISLSSPIKVWYKSLPRAAEVLWPILDLKLSYGETALPQPVFSLVDSGASISILHPEVAEILGVNLRKLGPPRLKGQSVSGDYKSWLLPEPVKGDIYGYELEFQFEVIDNRGLSWPCILGEDSIFQVARIDFQKFKGFFKVRFRTDIN